jgi:hypothetical protein
LDVVTGVVVELFKYENEPAAATRLENLVFWSSTIFVLFSLLVCFGFVQQIQFVLSESFLTKHSEHVHLALLLLFIIVFGFEVEQQAQLVINSSFCTKHVVQVHFDDDFISSILLLLVDLAFILIYY